MKTGGMPASGYTPSETPGPLRRSKNVRKSLAGFTIVEVLIVLAVTGGLFASAVTLLNGRQNKTDFYTAINDMQQQMQQVINETASGYYPGDNTFSCTPHGASNYPKIDTLGVSEQGTRNGCIFLGKVVQFGSPEFTDPEKYTVWPIVGNQLDSSGDPVTTIADALPAPVDPIKTVVAIPGGMTVPYMHYNGSVNNTSGIGFLAGDASGAFASASATGGLASGGQQLSLYAINSSSVTNTTTSQMNNILSTSSSASSKYVHANIVEICFNSGTTKQSGLITIGAPAAATNRQQSVTLQIFPRTGCA